MNAARNTAGGQGQLTVSTFKYMGCASKLGHIFPMCTNFGLSLQLTANFAKILQNWSYIAVWILVPEPIPHSTISRIKLSGLQI